MSGGSESQLPHTYEELKSATLRLKENALVLWETQTLFSVNSWLCKVFGDGTVGMPDLLSKSPQLVNYFAPQTTPRSQPVQSAPWFVRFFGLTFQVEGLIGDSSYNEILEILKSGRGIERLRVGIPRTYSRKYAYPVGNRWTEAVGRLVRGVADYEHMWGQTPPQPPPEDPDKLRDAIVADIQKVVNLCIPISQDGWVAWSLAHGCPVPYLKVQYPFLNVADFVDLGLTHRNGFGGFSPENSWIDAYSDLVTLVVFARDGDFDVQRPEYSTSAALDVLGVSNPPRLSAGVVETWQKALAKSDLPAESWSVVRRVCENPDKVEIRNNLKRLAGFLGPGVSPQEVVNRLSPFFFLGSLRLKGGSGDPYVLGWEDLCDLVPPVGR